MASTLANCFHVKPLFSRLSCCSLLKRSLTSSSGRKENREGWFSKLTVRRIEPTKEPHSRMLSDKDVIYELQTHNVKPDSRSDYLSSYETTVKLIESHKDVLHSELVGSWTVEVGDLDQSLHLWKHTGGFSGMDVAKQILSKNNKDLVPSTSIAPQASILSSSFQDNRKLNNVTKFHVFWTMVSVLKWKDKGYVLTIFKVFGDDTESQNRFGRFYNNEKHTQMDYIKLEEERGRFLRSRHLQYLLSFSYWPQIEMREGTNIYEIRSYSLKPGTMIEWGNNWARAINYRRSNQEAFAGFFSQVGRLYNVHHIWCYKDFHSRKEIRESAWRLPGWDECVAHTVPLIREMHSRLLRPTQFSKTQ